MMFLRPATRLLSRPSCSLSTDPRANSSPRESIERTNRRTAMIGKSTAAGGITACRRLPSASRASIVGWARSSRKPSGAITRSTAAITAASSAKVISTGEREPLFSMYTECGPLTKTSLTSGSLSNTSSGPRPTRPSTTSSTSWSLASGASSAMSRLVALRRCSRSSGVSEESRAPVSRSVSFRATANPKRRASRRPSDGPAGVEPQAEP